MENLKKDYIKQIFTNWDELKEDGIYLSGIGGEGEHKRWYENGQLWIHSFFKNNKREGESKWWYSNGQLGVHYFFKNNKKIDIPKDKIKDGYTYVDGKYYKD